MSFEIKPTEHIKIDERKISVAELPEAAKRLIPFYDDWRRKEIEVRSQLLMVQNAMSALANQIAIVVKKVEEDEATAEIVTAKPAQAPAEAVPAPKATEAPAVVDEGKVDES
jgi:hypothetical protein